MFEYGKYQSSAAIFKEKASFDLNCIKKILMFCRVFSKQLLNIKIFE
jgi:hypothetical protein